MDTTSQARLHEEIRIDERMCPDSLLVSAKQAAQMCAKSVRTWRS